MIYVSATRYHNLREQVALYIYVNTRLIGGSMIASCMLARARERTHVCVRGCMRDATEFPRILNWARITETSSSQDYIDKLSFENESVGMRCVMSKEKGRKKEKKVYI